MNCVNLLIICITGLLLCNVLADEAKKPLPLTQLMMMKKDGVDPAIIQALILDSIPGGAAMADIIDLVGDEKVSQSAVLALIAGKGIDLPEELIFQLTNTDPKSVLINQLSEKYDTHPTVMEILMDGSADKNILTKHYITKMGGDDLSPVQVAMIRAMLNGEEFTKDSLMGALASQMYEKEDIYTKLGMKAMMNGDSKNGLVYLLLSQTKTDKLDFSHRYAKNEAIFAYIAEQTNDGKISAQTVMDIALGEKISALNPDASFTDIFGVKAYDFVCAAHHDEILLDCSAQYKKTVWSPLECVNAGCCYRTTGCYENVLGKIGVGLARDMIDEDHVTEILGGELPDLEQFWPDAIIPWIPSASDPAEVGFAEALTGRGNDFLNSYHFDNFFTGLKATAMPNIAPNERRPNFVWKPHGVTPFPFATEIPQAIAINDNDELTFGGPPAEAEAAEAAAPLIPGMTGIETPDTSCIEVAKADRIACISNIEALGEGGEEACAATGCCFAPDYSDLTKPACFQQISYGQCYNIEDEEKIDCGSPGISQDECLSNPRCCWDSTTTNNKFGINSYIPWCFYKKNSFILSDEKCARSSYSEPCFEGSAEKWNSMISEESCVAAGCCYQKPKSYTFLQRVLAGLRVKSDRCFKPASTAFKKVDPAPVVEPEPATEPPPDPVCKYDSNPNEREDCGNYWWFTCEITKGCCYKREIFYKGTPWCFKKS